MPEESRLVILVISEIEARNLGTGNGGEHKQKEQYVTLSLKGKKKKTEHPGSPDSGSGHEDGGSKWCKRWKESLDFDLGEEELQRGDFVKIKITQPGLIRDKLLASAKLPVEELISKKGETIPFTIGLQDGNDHPIEAIFKCAIKYICPGSISENQTNASTEGKDSVDAGFGGIPLLTTRTHIPTGLQKIPFPEKPRDFQVRIKVIEGRHISGRDVNPVVRVTVGKFKEQTGVKHTTNQPYYNQTFPFNFYATKFQDLFEEQIKFEVFDSRRLRHDSLIGFYKCDVRELYNFQGHMVLRKWIVLAEPRQSEKIIQGENVITRAHGFGGNACGFLKVSMVVLEAHMTAPSLENIVGLAEDDNIESNLLHLPGVSLSPAIFSLKIYKAEDIPQMDHEDLFNRFRKKRKESADPYCIFSFAGKQATSSTKFDSRSPQFNEKLNLSFKYPSVCDNLKIQLMDKDFGTLDDYIGTIYLPVSHLSGQGGNEFLPTFGPCFVNMYGSPREYSDWPNKHEDLDKGIGEGAAYRGRVFLELVTKLDEKKQQKIEHVKNVDIVRVQPYMRRKRFRLLAVFLEATMLAVEDSQVEFEISIGNYGNKLDDSVSPRPSSTPPTNPVFDGEKYFYLPWGNSKPYVSIDCEWEDVSFRLGILNKLLRICRNLERNINMIKSTKGEKYRKRVFDTLDSLIVDSSTLPNLDPKMFKLTKLDLQMSEMRKDVLKTISEECKELKKKLDDPETLEKLEFFLKRIQMIAVEPQNSMPDVIIWMIKAERERIAYCRIPAYELLYCEDESQRGRNCGKTIDINLKFPGKEDSSHKSKYAAILRLMVWLGRQKHQSKWEELENTGGKLSLFAETYENQTFYGKWTSVNLSRPAFSNASGTLELPKGKFEAPNGWKFVGDWEVHSEISAQFRKDSGCKVFLEVVFENEYRLIPGGQWKEHKDQRLTDRFGHPILDNHGKPINSKDNIDPPNGWQWSQHAKWIVDTDRAVDSAGWEYTMEPSYGTTDYEAAEKTLHFSRRRRWIKERSVKDVKMDVVPILPTDKDGWEYAFTFKSKFHTQSKPLHIVRRKRLRKQLVQERHTTAEPVFIVKDKDKEMDKNTVLVAPSIFLLFKDPIICQLRAYLFQGRNLLPSDPDGLADPFVRLSFGTRSATSRTINKKLNPTWDQMLVLERIPIYGHPDQVFENPPDVVLELFDWDPVGKNEFLGRVQVEPVVRQAEEESKTKLSWLGVYKGSSKCGDILAAFDLFLNEDTQLASPEPTGWFPIPDEIRPQTRRTAVEVFCWGLRNLRSYHWRKVNSPSIEIEIGDKIQKKSLLGNLRGNSNFEGQRVLCFDVNLPREVIYLPAITIQLKTSSSQSPIGICVVENLHEFRRKKSERRFSINEDKIGSSSAASETETISVIVDNGAVTQASKKKPKICDWWSKYYATKQATAKEKKQLTIYPHSLEKEFENFQDNIKTFYFRRGKMESFDEEDEESIVGEFKGALAIYDLQDDFKESLQPKVFIDENQMRSVPCLVRVYVVKGIDLKPKDKDGLSDPYLVVSLGDKTFDTKDEYEEDTLEVEFGKVFEFHAVIPDVKDLTVRVVDYDLGNDDLIGETKVDLENRLLSRRHATVGLPPTYEISGPNKWRLGKDYIPSKILESYCKDFDIKHEFEDNDSSLWLKCGERRKHYFNLAYFEDSNTDLTHAGEIKERLSLYILNSFMDEHSMVPEHIETRDLTNKLFPGFSQGKLEMFVDIFPEKYGMPGPLIDIAPRKPKKYELRVIVWNTKDVQLQETNIYGDEMSDIFVKCRLTGVEDVQKTDTHFRSLNGDGMFNYRMVFPFEYSETKGRVIIMKKAHFLSRRKYQDEQLPQLDIEVWDNDLLSSNDFIGDVKLDLQELAKPFGKSKDIKDLKLSSHKNSLFEKGIVRGWWPVAGKPKKKKGSDSESEAKSNELVLTGKVELTLELLEEKDAKSKPVGKGQSKPNQHPVLEKPKRPATSFLWILNPWKSFRYVIWSHFKWYFIGAILLILIVLFFALFLYASPGYSVKKLFNV